MMNFDSGEAERTIDEVFDLLSEEHLIRSIDEPIEGAAASFDFHVSVPVTPEIFATCTGDFVDHVYRHGLSVPRIMSTIQAHAEALQILERGYQSAQGGGYNIALLDALNPEHNGLEVVLGQMTQLITAMARTRHVRWVFASSIESADWASRILMTEVLLKRWGLFLSESIMNCAPAQLADYLPELINLLISTDRMVNKMLTGEMRLREGAK
jgi:hypothetical protein